MDLGIFPSSSSSPGLLVAPSKLEVGSWEKKGIIGSWKLREKKWGFGTGKLEVVQLPTSPTQLPTSQIQLPTSQTQLPTKFPVSISNFPVWTANFQVMASLNFQLPTSKLELPSSNILFVISSFWDAPVFCNPCDFFVFFWISILLCFNKWFSSWIANFQLPRYNLETCTYQKGQVISKYK